MKRFIVFLLNFCEWMLVIISSFVSICMNSLLYCRSFFIVFEICLLKVNDIFMRVVIGENPQ